MGLFHFFKKETASDLSVTEEKGVLLQPMDGEIIPLADMADGFSPRAFWATAAV